MSAVTLSLIFFILSTRPAHAYLDPGTGSYILQLIVGGVLGGLFILKNYWHSITGFLTRNRSKSKDDEPKTPSAA